MEHTRQKGDDLESMYCSEFVAETLQRCDYHGGALILAGIAVASVHAPHVTIAYDAREVTALISDPYGALYCILIALTAITAVAITGTCPSSYPIPESRHIVSDRKPQTAGYFRP